MDRHRRLRIAPCISCWTTSGSSAAPTGRTDPADANLETVVADLLSGQYSHPLGVVAFNTAQGWSRDVTGEVAQELLARAAALDNELAPHLREFLERV